MDNVNFIQSEPSAFAQLVDILRTKSDAELKMLYLRLFQKELNEEWKTVTNDIDFSKVTEEDIIKAIQKNRYKG